jgi:hypothetical protein
LRIPSIQSDHLVSAFLVTQIKAGRVAHCQSFGITPIGVSRQKETMTAYVIVHFTVKDQEKLAQYGAGAGPTLAAFGGEFVTRGTVTEVL